MNPPSNAAEVDSWYNSLSNSEKEQLFKCIPDKMLKCRDPAKRAHLEMCWKPELSDDIDLLKYEEHESGLFYECPSILEYIRDCRLRQETVTSESIRDYELVHHDKPQKLFLWIPTRYGEMIDAFQEALKDFLSSHSTKPITLTADVFEGKFIIVTNVIVGGYEEKIKLLVEFKKTLLPELADPLILYIAKKPDTYEKIPSITNAGYLNSVTRELVRRGYRPDAALIKQIQDTVTSHTSDRSYGNITIININITTNNYYNGGKSDYVKFVEHILVEKPTWYTPNTWLPKSILVKKFNERFDTDISSNVFMRNMHSEGLMNQISEREKRARMGGKPQSLFLSKNF